MIHSPFDIGNFDFIWVAHPSPAAGADFSIGLPVNARCDLVALSFQYACDANVADRSIRLYNVHGGLALVIGGAEYPLTANQTRQIIVGPLGFSSIADGGDVQVIGTPSLPILLEGGLINSLVQGKQATDAITAIQYALKVWIYEQ